MINNINKNLIWYLIIIVLIILIIRHGEAKVINYDLSEYGSLYYTNNYDDGTMLICSSKLEDVYIGLIYPNGSKISVNYENGINFKNISPWNLIGCWPSAINYILLLYYNRSDPIINTTLRGTILNIKGEITTNDNGVANPISSGSLKSPLKGYRFYSQVTFFKVDGQYAIVYIVTDLTKSFEVTTDYNRPRFSMYLHFIKDNMDESSEQMLLYQYYGSTLTNVFLTDCQAGFNSLGLQSNICFLTYLALDAMEYIKFIQFSSSGSIIQEGFLSTSTLTLQFRPSLNTTSDYNILFQTINADIVSSGIFNNNTIWVVYGNGTIIGTVDNSKLTTIDVEHIYNDCALLLRQVYSASSHCEVYNITTLSCPVLSSTFNRINSDYMIIVEDNFVRALSFNEPFYGIKQGVWQVKTPKSYNSKVSDSTQAILRLNSDGSSYFSNYNKTQFDDLLQQIKETIPLMNDRLQITHNIQPDPLDFSKLLIEFSISKANDPLNDPSVDNIINNLDNIIKNKYISALSDKKFMMFLDDQYGFKVKPNLWDENKYKILVLAITIIILIVIYSLAQRFHPKVVNGHDVPSLFIPCLVILIISISFNLTLSLFLVINEIRFKEEFQIWFTKKEKMVSFFIIISSTDIGVLTFLSSKFFGLPIFSAPLSPKAKLWIFYITIVNLFIEDIPHLTIQIIYQRSVILYTIIPLITLITSVLVLIFNIVTSIIQFWVYRNSININR
ncbi:hypothetical protein F8M41_022526 [Gigaspora margarita]|uniref:Uncharacterized protein n=1 Tax=Gigaspora margarita TaxID=4874 RepID=A0A8H4EVV1_GIGMA|nr:hypothetical protein F8M41_022526 [Gigaspora margarita]